MKLFMEQINQREKTLVFCATQDHALAVRDLINQMKTSNDPNYCQRVTADDGALGEQHLRDFQDNEKTIPTILTTSQKLSTGVDARNIRNIVLMRPINSMIEFKQIIGRGTRLYDGKDYFTIYDFVKAHQHFSDPEWDGEPLEPEPKEAKARARHRGPPDRQVARDDRRTGSAEEDQGQAGRRQGAHHPAHDGDDVLASRRHADVGAAVHGDAVRQAAGVLQGRGRTARALERAGHAEEAAAGSGREGIWRRATGRDAEDHRRREERPVRRAGPRRLRPPAGHPRGARRRRPRSPSARTSTASSRPSSTSCCRITCSVGVEELDQEKLTPLLRLKYHDSIADAVADLGRPEEIGQGLRGLPEVSVPARAAA